MPTEESLAFMEKLEQKWQKETGLTHRRYYSIFYTAPQPSPILVLNFNPSGTPEDFQEDDVVNITNGQHEFIEGIGATSIATGRILQQALGLETLYDISFVQSGNVIWRRSHNLQELRMAEAEAATETAPFLQELIEYIAPRAIIFGGITALNHFIQAHQPSSVTQIGDILMGPNGSNEAVYFQHQIIKLPYLENPIDVFTIFHPSRGVRPKIVEHLSKALNTLKIKLAKEEINSEWSLAAKCWLNS